jgi:hypothetical protein
MINGLAFVKSHQRKPQAKMPEPRRSEKRKTIKNKTSTEKKGDSTHDVYFFLVPMANLFQSEEFLNNLFDTPDFSKARKNYERYGATL